MVCLKLITHPLLAYFIFQFLLDLTPEEQGPEMLLAAAPRGIIGFMFALNYKVDTQTTSSAILYTSIGSLAKLTMVTNLYAYRK